MNIWIYAVFNGFPTLEHAELKWLGFIPSLLGSGIIWTIGWFIGFFIGEEVKS